MTTPDFPLTPRALRDFVRAALTEDIGPGDITCASVIPEGARLSATAHAREPLVCAGLPLAEAVFRELDTDCRFGRSLREGEGCAVGDAVFDVSGRARALLSAERTALNILQHLSGIATLTRRYADAIAGTGARLLDTRKTLPLWRPLAKYATALGGAVNHRMGLYDAVMIKDNHIAVAGSVSRAVAAARAAGRDGIQVECDSLAQVAEALDAGADRLLLDNMPLHDLRRAVALAAGRATTEASGGITLETIRAVAETGVDFVSVGRLTQSAPAVDIGLDFAGA